MSQFRRAVSALAPWSFLLAACGGDDKEANTGQPAPVQCPPGQYFDGQYCQIAQPAGAAPTATAPAPTATAPAGTAPPAGPIAVGQAGPQATPLDPTMAQTVTTLLGPLAQQSAPAGAKPVGSAIAGQFQQGQSLEQQVQMQPGKCYTVVGAGLPPVQNLDIQFLPMVPIPGIAAPVIAQDQTVAPNAVVGEKDGCFKWPMPVAGPMKIVVTVSQGSGVAAAQVYEK
ncbi:MAG TPA: hypothetical protein VF989_09890 [Polyangiaceae bacterium]